jgi:hypothetical protein
MFVFGLYPSLLSLSEQCSLNERILRPRTICILSPLTHISSEVLKSGVAVTKPDDGVLKLLELVCRRNLERSAGVG